VVFLVILDSLGRKTLFPLPEFVVGHDAPKDDVAVAYPPQHGAELHGRFGFSEDSDKRPILYVLQNGLAAG